MRKKCVLFLILVFVLIIFNSCSDAPYKAEMEVYELGVFIDFYGKKIPPIERINKMVLVTYSGLKEELSEDKLILGTVTIPEKTEVTITVIPLDEENDYTDITTDDGENISDRVYTFTMERDRAVYVTLSNTPIEKADYYFGIDGNGYIDLSVTRKEDDSLSQRYEIRTNSKIPLGKDVFEKHNVTLQAIASNDNVFEKWSDGNLNPTYEITSERDDTLTAIFRKGETVNFNFAKTGNGFIAINITNKTGNVITNLNALNPSTTVTIPKAMLSTNTMRIIAYPEKNNMFYRYSGGLVSRESSAIVTEDNSKDTIQVDFLLLEQPKESDSDDWVYISKPEHIQWVANELNNTNYVVAIGKYKFKNNIDFAGKPHIPIGTHNSPFQGIIDGNNHVIKNAIYTAYDDYVYHGGLVGVSKGAIISNVIIDSSVIVTNIANSLGGIVGEASENSVISNCINNANITALSGRFCSIGGIVGYAVSVSIYNSYNTGNMKGGYKSGGIVGNYHGDASKMINVYNTGSVSGNMVGGITGYASHPNFVNAYSIAPSIVGGTYFGGLIGSYINSSISLKNNYFVLIENVPINNNGFGIGEGDTTKRTIASENLYTLTDIFNAQTPGIWKNVKINEVNRPVLIGVGEGK